MRQHVEQESHEMDSGCGGRLLGRASASVAVFEGMSGGTPLGADCCLRVVQKSMSRRMCVLVGTGLLGLCLGKVARKLGCVLAQIRRTGGRMNVQLHYVSWPERDVGRVRWSSVVLVDGEGRNPSQASRGLQHACRTL